ncbi:MULTISPECIES: phytoene/squalene synthase family protein [Pseudomonas]|uniref:Phytoene/squalene synthase family protein n=1 Tax=Pseudomonas gingeri TaxID=117681 RepID=A0A7Y8BQC7_9PSED|nr:MULTISPECIES: phytoene/squalene synthase family protein [Pseudomonas]NWB84018.1 phytoene/squalene synthase family protein [Pseudomonas gingeri]
MPFTQATGALAPQSALGYQEAIFPQVSRSFALTIPQLPPPLNTAMTTAYLLCRIADTIEDEPTLSITDKQHYEAAYIRAVLGEIDARPFCDELGPLLSEASSPAERALLSQLPRVLEVLRTLDEPQQATIVRCLRVMCLGMGDFQRVVGLQGLETLSELKRYCYCVAGVVGEMFTELFVDFAPELVVHQERMASLALSFGEGLQLTNILKDQWEDRRRGVCWLPRDLFARHGVCLLSLHTSTQPGYGPALTELIGIAHAHLRRALDYTLLIAPERASLRFFCLHSIGLAILTLRNLHRRADFHSGSQVKVPRGLAMTTLGTLRSLGGDNAGLRGLFDRATRSLPLTRL